MKVAVVVVGASLEFAGIILVASPDLAPWLGRFRHFALATLSRTGNWPSTAHSL